MDCRLILAESVQREIVADCLAHGPSETGGILLGVVSGSKFIVPFSVPAGPRAERTRVRFSPDAEWQQAFLDYLFRRFRTDYVGDWHRHPGLFDSPSDHDLQTARTIVSDSSWNKVSAVFPIAVIDEGAVRMRGYVMTRETRVFAEIPITTVPDTDPEIIAVLTGMDATEKEVGHAEPKVPAARAGSRGSAVGRFMRRTAARLRSISPR